jgi:hypothetical protein
MNVVETLQEEQNALTTKLEELDERIKSERPGLVAQLAQVTKAIKALTGAMVPRKPMSPEAKERIRQGLEKARAAKAAGTVQPIAPTSAPIPTKTTDEAGTSKKPSTGDKGARAN